jgi:anti-sigma factor RsiW
MNRIDDNTLAAYLEGSLPDEERILVEQAIEEDDELKAIVDEWISMADDIYKVESQDDDRELRMEACRNIWAVMEQVKRESGAREVVASAAMPERFSHRVAAAKPRWPLYRRVLVAASLLAFVSATGIWALRSPEEGMGSAPSFDVPMDGDYMSCPTEDTTIVNTNMQFQN